MEYLFLDLDGLLLDVSEKFYRTYHDLLTSRGFKPLEKNIYWNLKRAKTAEKEILKLSGAENYSEQYKQDRIAIIETDPYQQMDVLQPGALNVLQLLSDRYKLVLVTIRMGQKQTWKQLEWLGIKSYFTVVLNQNADNIPKWKIKFQLVNSYFNNQPPRLSLFIGDTETDILAGKNLGYTTVAVLNGMRTRELIEKEVPDYIINSINDLPKLNII